MRGLVLTLWANSDPNRCAKIRCKKRALTSLGAVENRGAALIGIINARFDIRP
jgi:hypothetical protein